MKTSRLAAIAVAALLALPVGASAQTAFHFQGVKNTTVNLAGWGIGPYQATSAASPSPFDIYCIDFDNRAQTSWTGRVLTFAQAVNPMNLAGVTKALGGTPAWGITQLQAAAYLTTQFTEGNRTGGKWDDIHGAIWSMFSTSNVPHVGNWATYQGDALTYAGAHQSDFDNYVIIVDERAFTEYQGALSQTFITDDGDLTVRVVTPEPSAYAMMGIGLLGLGVAQRRRRRA